MRASKGERLCDYWDVCPSGYGDPAPWTGGKKSSDQWVAVLPFRDGSMKYEYVQIGTRAQSTLSNPNCYTMSEIGYNNYASWGASSGHTSHIPCCPLAAALAPCTHQALTAIVACVFAQISLSRSRPSGSHADPSHDPCCTCSHSWS